MSSFPPEGLSVRGATLDDVKAAAAIVRAEEVALRGESDFGQADLVDFWRASNLADASWFVERERIPVGFAACIERDAESMYWITVHPDVSGRGLSTWLLARGEERALVASSRRLRVGAIAENAAARRLFADRSYREARHYFTMRINLEHELERPVWPDGISVATFRPEDARAVHAALNEAFAEEWGWHSLPFEEWREHRLEAPHADVSLWFIAWESDEVAGVARCEDNRDGGGWVGAIGVCKPWRGRGVGRALLLHAFDEFRRRGDRHVGLGVDAENPTGATRIYESVGMRVIKEDVIFEKELA
jgi:mycothiol synthase